MAVDTKSKMQNEGSTQPAKLYKEEIEDILYDTTTKTIYCLNAEELAEIKADEKFLELMLKPLKRIQSQNATNENIFETKKQVQSDLSKVLSPISKAGKASELSEIRRLSGKKFTYIRSDRIKNHWRGYKLDVDDSKRSKLRTNGKLDLDKLKKELAKSANPTVGFKWKIFDQTDIQGFTDWANTFSDEVKYQFGDDYYQKDSKRTFDASAEAQWMRFAAGANFTSNIEPLKGKIAINAKGESSFAIAEGKTEIKGYIPNAEGYHLKFDMPINREATAHKPVDFGYVMVELAVSLYGFAGASALLDIGVGFDVGTDGKMKLQTAYESAKANKQEAKLAGDLFAGVKGGCDVDSSLKWKNPEEKQAFSLIAKAGYGVSVAAGLGINGAFAIGYKGGKLYVKAEAGVVCGVGASGKMVYAVDGKTVYTLCQFVYHQLMKEDYSYVGFIENEAFNMLSAYAVEYVMNGASDINKKLELWWDDFEVGKKEATKLANNILSNSSKILQFTTPEAKGRMLYVLTQTFWTSDEELQELAILKVLSWVQSQREANKVFTSITSDTKRKIAIQDGIKKLNNVLDGSEKKKYDLWYASLPYKPMRMGLQIAQVTTMDFPVNLNRSYYA